MFLSRTKYGFFSLCLFLAGILPLSNSFAQQSQAGNFIHTRPDIPYFKSYITDLDDFLLRPVKWEPEAINYGYCCNCSRSWIILLRQTGQGFFHQAEF
jgi:hypothetical protein